MLLELHLTDRVYLPTFLLSNLFRPSGVPYHLSLIWNLGLSKPIYNHRSTGTRLLNWRLGQRSKYFTFTMSRTPLQHYRNHRDGGKFVLTLWDPFMKRVPSPYYQITVFVHEVTLTIILLFVSFSVFLIAKSKSPRFKNDPL